MSDTTIDEVQQFLEQNKEFFISILKNEYAFKSYFEDSGNMNALNDYSEKFSELLKNTMHTGEHYAAPVWILWRKGDFDTALQHVEVRQFIMDNSNHTALKVWQDKH
jgi:hypothetical protein